MIHLQQVNDTNIHEILSLSVHKEQKDFVADNQASIDELKESIEANGQGSAFGIYDENKAVGFVMIGFDTDEAWENPPEIAHGNYSLWRLLIDHTEQGKGYGKAALKLALEYVESFPFGKAEFIWTSYHPHNTAARHLYLSSGFEETDEMDGDEVIAVYRL